MQSPLVDRTYLLEVFPGKGGWTYAVIPEIQPDSHAPFGWVQVQGSIDGLDISHTRLMPLGNGQLILPVKAALRKRLKKQAGDQVHVVLYPYTIPQEIPDELRMCLDNEPQAAEFFYSLDSAQRHRYVQWIYAANTEQKRVNRIVQALDRLCKHLLLTDRP